MNLEHLNNRKKSKESINITVYSQKDKNGLYHLDFNRNGEEWTSSYFNKSSRNSVISQMKNRYITRIEQINNYEV
ncbi:MAG: hypothetical protein ACRCZW_14585 [Lactobacillaceae bacterium]